MTLKCLGCGVRQERWKDRKGIEATNIDPTTGLCVACLVKRVAAEPRPVIEDDDDYRQRQTGEEA
jgi:hypothetical protein